MLHSLPHLQDLNNYSLHKEAVSGYSAPGGPINYPFYRVHSTELSPKPSSPTSPSMLRSPSTPNRNSFGFLPASPTGSPFSSPGSPFSSLASPFSPLAMHDEGHLDPKHLVNTAPDDLPDGVDPSRKEVGARFEGQGLDELNSCQRERCKATMPGFMDQLYVHTLKGMNLT